MALPIYYKTDFLKEGTYIYGDNCAALLKEGAFGMKPHEILKEVRKWVKNEKRTNGLTDKEIKKMINKAAIIEFHRKKNKKSNELS